MNSSGSVADVVRSPPKKRFRIIIALAFFSQWSGNGLVSYYLSKVLNAIGITSSFDQTLINGILQIFNYITSITAALLIDKVGRRTLALGGVAGMLLFFTVSSTNRRLMINAHILPFAAANRLLRSLRRVCRCSQCCGFTDPPECIRGSRCNRLHLLGTSEMRSYSRSIFPHCRTNHSPFDSTT